MREFPIIRTLDAVDINSSGATFQGELIKEGFTSTSSYGFLWDTKDPLIDDSYKVILGENIKKSVFKIRIDSNLVNDVEYKVRTFATCNNKTVYGNIMKFLSKGSTKSAWSLEMEGFTLAGWGQIYGCSDNETGYIIFQSSEFYSIDPEKKEVLRSSNFPISGSNRFTSIAIGNIQYFLNDVDRNLYKFQAGSWIQQSNVPLRYYYYGAYYHGFAVSDTIFILSPKESYMYNVNTDLWQIKAKLPEDVWLYGGTNIKNKAYVIAMDKNIWEYDTGNDTWIKKTEYPGRLAVDIISFSFKSKLYYGLSRYRDPYLYHIDRKIWIYDPASNIWDCTQEFPIDLSFEKLFFFYLNDKLYIGIGKDKYYNLWKFDPSKI
jgi:hypothetical protein